MAERELAESAPVEVSDNGEILHVELETPVIETPPVTQEEPEKPATETPKARATPAGVCPDCGYVSIDAKDLKKHIHFKHKLADARRLAAERKLAEARASAAPPADFTDIERGLGETDKLPPSTPIAVVPDARFEGMANMTFDMSTHLLAKIFGPEWLPNADADNPQVSHERMTMVEAIKKYYESVNLPDIPPGYMLCFVCLAYAAPRMAAAPTRTKLQGAWIWLKTKFQRRRAMVPTIVK